MAEQQNEENRFYHTKSNGITTLHDRRKAYPQIVWNSEKMVVAFMDKLNAGERALNAQPNRELETIYDAFGIGVSARNIKTLMTNLENIMRFADYLKAVEHEFFMVPGTPSDEPEDAGIEPDDECLLNRWGSTKEQYIEQFRNALSTLKGLKGLGGDNEQ